MDTRNWSARKKLWFTLAGAWTILILVLCLVRFNDLPSVSVSGADKYVHATFHGIFTLLWFGFASADHQTAFRRAAAPVILGSLAFGILIELAQSVFTETRKGDVLDVAANFAGCLLAVGLLYGWRQWKIQKQSS